MDWMDNAGKECLQELYGKALKELPMDFLLQLKKLHPYSTIRLGRPFADSYNIDMHKIVVPVVRDAERDSYSVIFDNEKNIVKKMYELRLDGFHPGSISSSRIILSYDCVRKKREDAFSQIRFPGNGNYELKKIKKFQRLIMRSSHDVKPLSDAGIVKPEAVSAQLEQIEDKGLDSHDAKHPSDVKDVKIVESKTRIISTQFKQLAEETGLNKLQIMNYGSRLRDAGIFPPHKSYKRNQYSEKELDVLKKVGDYKQKNSITDSIKSALIDVYGEDSPQLQKFVLWQQKISQRRSSMGRETRRKQRRTVIENGLKTSYFSPMDYDAIVGIDNETLSSLPNMHDMISKRLVRDFLSSHGDSLESYPLNLYFAIYIPRHRHMVNQLKKEMVKLMPVSKQYASFDEYENCIFGAYMSRLNGMTQELQEPFRIARDRLSKENIRWEEIIEKRYMQDGKTRSLDSVGKDFEITKERVRQLQNRAIEKLKTYEEIIGLDSLLIKETGPALLAITES